jgi:hypothetical protein
MHRRGSGGYPPSNHAVAQLGIPDVIPARKSQAFAADTNPTLRNRILSNATKPTVNRRLGRSSRSTIKRQQADYARKAVLPKIADLHNPLITGFVAAYEDHKIAGTRVYDVAGRTYMGRVAEIPSRYGRDQLLAILVPVDEIEQPIIDIRNETLLYSIAFLVLALPLYATLVVVWIDRRLQRATPTAAVRGSDPFGGG